MTKSRAMNDNSKSCNCFLVFFSVAHGLVLKILKSPSNALAMNNTVSPPSPSLEKMIKSLGSYFFRNSASRKPNSEIILLFFSFLFFFILPKSLGFERIASPVRSTLSIGESGEGRSWGWKRLWLLGLACAELGVFGVTGTILLVWWHKFFAAEKFGYPW